MPIYEDSEVIVFQTALPVLFSPLMEKKLGLALQWKAWKPRIFEVRANGTLVYRKDRTSPIKDKFNIAKVKITQLANNNVSVNALIQKENGIVVSCQSMDGFETYFRCILNDGDLDKFYESLRKVTQEHNLDNITRSSLTNHLNPSIAMTNQSVMRRTLAKAMDSFDSRSKKERVVARRGAFKYLPVFFPNDLVHGSWWFVVGSVFFAVTSLMVLLNSWDDVEYLGQDDSILSRFRYRSTWVLMVISGVFCTLGSMAFVRSVHEEPPMKPIFASWYHLQSDELLGSWLFLLATLPIIPYSLIYIAASGDDLVYLGALAVAILLVAGSYLFVRACYPTENNKPSMKFIQPMARCLCWCFCSERWLRKNIANDWLAGTWFIYWGTLLASIVCLVLLVVAIHENSSLLIFVLATGFFENFCFLVGSAYFVAGSYPEIAEEESFLGDDLEASASYYVDRDVSDNVGTTKVTRSTAASRSGGNSDESLSTPFITNEHF